MKNLWNGWALAAGLMAGVLLLPSQTRAANEVVTVPLVVADYYGWAYTEAFMDNAQVYAWTTAGVDALGWGLLVTTGDYDAGLKFVNLAGMAKTLYPVVTLLAATDPGTRERAWIAVGTHSATLLTLQFLGQPALVVQALGPRHDAYGAALAMRF